MAAKRFFRHLLIKTGLSLVFVGASCGFSSAKEGMWLPPNLLQRAADLKAEGLEFPVDMLYNSDGTGLNNAVVLFGRGCTGEVISPNGLILTNHHCGYGSVQRLSSLENDYFAKGFWAMNSSQELPCPGLTVTFIRKMENVSDRILYGISDTMAQATRDSIISIRIEGLEKGYKFTSKLDATIEPYYNGNQYWVILSETYRDVRLVGFPPNGIGVFGGDTDNWMWPRHNGDFSMFRIYAGKNNQPADYNKDNQPYKAKRYFTINTKGYKEGDFTMVYGFPGRTQEYISSYSLQQIEKINDPVNIEVRTAKLKVWEAAMAADRDVFIKYTSKRSGVSNGWKKWQGELRGLELAGVNARKLAYEYDFQAWANGDETTPYADNLLAQIQAVTAKSNDALRADRYIREAVYGVELISQGAVLDKLLQHFREVRKGATKDNTFIEKIKGQWAGFLKNYDAPTDEKLFATLLPIFMEQCPKYVPDWFAQNLRAANGSYARWAKNSFAASVVAHPAAWDKLIAGNADTVTIKNDPAWQLFNAIRNVREARTIPILSTFEERMESLDRLYMAAQMKKDIGKAFYPDANLTLRLAYGHVKGIDPDGPAGYSFQTYIDEIVAKDQPGSEEFSVPQKLKELYAKQDYGRWAIPMKSPENGRKTTVPVAFVADNHTSGGNSGSPVLNAKGELIGINFDRVWDGTMSDLYFDEARCRNISVDIRYVMWVVQKFGGADWLLKEMKFVR
ncbi:MAG: S46 family peptidase [Bacteroidetes bacterium]|nr:S46 family peptidase [Bacteroidota bacterium]